MRTACSAMGRAAAGHPWRQLVKQIRRPAPCYLPAFIASNPVLSHRAALRQLRNKATLMVMGELQPGAVALQEPL